MEPKSPEDKSFADVKDRLAYLNAIQAKLEELSSSRDGVADPQVFHVTTDGRTFAEETAKLFEGKRGIDMHTAQEGDVLWWTSKSGSKGYFVVGKRGGEGAVIEGAVRILSKDGKVREHQDIVFAGGGGHLLKHQTAVEGMPLVFTIFGKQDFKDAQKRGISDEEFMKDYMPRELKTTPVVDMGIIKAEILQDKPKASDAKPKFNFKKLWKR